MSKHQVDVRGGGKKQMTRGVRHTSGRRRAGNAPPTLGCGPPWPASKIIDFSKTTGSLQDLTRHWAEGPANFRGREASQGHYWRSLFLKGERPHRAIIGRDSFEFEEEAQQRTILRVRYFGARRLEAAPNSRFFFGFGREFRFPFPKRAF